MDRIVGTCGNCGGPVVVPDAWLGTMPPVPTCKNCGAQVSKPYGPTLEMGPSRYEGAAAELAMAWVNKNARAHTHSDKPKEGE